VPEASRLLDATRKALAADPDLLYEMAHLYDRVGQKPMTEQVLREVLRLDPNHPGAANDLGYTLGEDGRDLEEAERLTRQAVAADPVNPSFLDSLGWVLYKRGRFDEARQELGRAVEASQSKGEDVDPIVLDHLGDATYRAGDAPAAAERWKQALRQLSGQGGEGESAGGAGAAGAAGSAGSEGAGATPEGEHASLRLRLERKTKQIDAAQPASVAPVAVP
jgi:Tfp pilus assembly protein PilF